jgi:hypothetical protein
MEGVAGSRVILRVWGCLGCLGTNPSGAKLGLLFAARDAGFTHPILTMVHLAFRGDLASPSKRAMKTTDPAASVIAPKRRRNLTLNQSALVIQIGSQGRYWTVRLYAGLTATERRVPVK